MKDWKGISLKWLLHEVWPYHLRLRSSWSSVWGCCLQLSFCMLSTAWHSLSLVWVLVKIHHLQSSKSKYTQGDIIALPWLQISRCVLESLEGISCFVAWGEHCIEDIIFKTACFLKMWVVWLWIRFLLFLSQKETGRTWHKGNWMAQFNNKSQC